jgi:hypothetical protein
MVMAWACCDFGGKGSIALGEVLGAAEAKAATERTEAMVEETFMVSGGL